MKHYELKTAGRIAWRYFFSKKGTNAVHVISIVAVAAIALVTIAMVVVLSVFNGFERFTNLQLSDLSPAYKVVRNDGKVFSPNTITTAISSVGLAHHGSPVLTEQALASFEENTTTVRLVGVDSTYPAQVPIDRFMFDGDFDLGSNEAPCAVLGIGVATQLGAGAGYLSPLELTVPKRTGKISTIFPAKDFRHLALHITGIFRVDQDEDKEVVYLPIEQLRRLLQYGSEEVSYIALGREVTPTQVAKLKQALGNDFRVLNEQEQHPEVYRVLRVEKWVSFLLLIFVLLLSFFSVISTLGMLIIEKREAAHIFSFLGGKRTMVDSIILLQGWLLTITGLTIGLLLGTTLVVLQEQFGFVKLGSSGMFLLEAYPVELQGFDLLGISIVILTIGLIGSYIAFRTFRWNRP